MKSEISRFATFVSSNDNIVVVLIYKYIYIYTFVKRNERNCNLKKI